MEYMSAKEAAEKWGITRRRVQVYCMDDRISGAVKVSTVWLIPKDAQKPSDPRKNNKRQDDSACLK